MYDKDNHKIIGSLIDKLGSKEECLRLGFLDKNDNETLIITTAGYGYLLQVVAAEVDTLAGAYAAGYQQACEELLAV